MLRQAILAATEDLLAERSFDEIRVDDILEASEVGRSSFYLYFESRHAVLAELVRSAFSEITEGSWPWVEQGPELPLRETIERAVRMGALHWHTHGPILRAVVEHWRSDPVLTELWMEIMESLISQTADRIKQAREQGLAPTTDADPEVLAGLLGWMSERAHYVAAIDCERFGDEEAFITGLVEVWTTVVFGGAVAHPQSARAGKRSSANGKSAKRSAGGKRPAAGKRT